MKFLGILSTFLRCLVLFVPFLAGCGGGDDGPNLRLVFSANLDSAQETPPNNSAGRGVGLMIVNPVDRYFTASAVTSGVAETAAHIHEGALGVAGPVVFPLEKAPGSVVWTASGTLSVAQLATLERGEYYFNVHSGAFPDGEIRGQIQRQMPTAEQVQALQQVQQQSELLRAQLEQVRQAQQQ